MSDKIKYRVNDQGITEYSDDDFDEVSSDYFSDRATTTDTHKNFKVEKLEDLP